MRTMLVMIDNYDSFTYNLVQYLGELGQDIKIFRNDDISIQQLQKLEPSYIMISPGPGRPENAGISKDIITYFGGKVPILGVCLGHQVIGEVFGGKVCHAPELIHGKTSPVTHDGKTIFLGLQNPFNATRYHSLIVDRKTLPETLNITAELEDGTIMGLRHKNLPIEGVQFHPESILTDQGKSLLQNFLNYYKP